jgi:uncharacterized pyridoxamine 5'-phosphate oxidase family protein
MRPLIIQEAVMAQIFSGRRVHRLKLYAGFILILALLLVPNITFLGCTKNEIAGQENTLKTEDMNIFVKILTEHPNGVLANRNGKALRTQIITFQLAEDNRVYFCTNNLKPMYKQLQRYPYVSFCTYAEDFEPVVSINGKVVFVEDSALKLRLFNGSTHLQRIYQNSDNPNLTVFYINIEEIETFGGDGVKIYKTK